MKGRTRAAAGGAAALTLAFRAQLDHPAASLHAGNRQGRRAAAADQRGPLPGVNAVYMNVVTHARAGAIVIQHFGGGPRFQTLAALPLEIAALRRRGYRFVSVAQLLDLRLLYR